MAQAERERRSGMDAERRSSATTYASGAARMNESKAMSSVCPAPAAMKSQFSRMKSKSIMLNLHGVLLSLILIIVQDIPVAIFTSFRRSGQHRNIPSSASVHRVGESKNAKKNH